VERHSELRGKVLLFILFFWFLWFLHFSSRMVFSPILPLIEDEFAISHARAVSIYLFQSTGYVLALLYSALWAGRLGYKKSIMVSLCLSSLASFLVPLGQAFPFLYATNFLYGLSVGIYLPSAIALITEYVAEKNWGRSLAIHDSGSSTGILCAPFIALFLLHFVEWRGIFAVFGIVFLAAAIVVYLAVDEVEAGHAGKSAFSSLVKTPALWTLGTLSIFAAGAALGVFFTVPLYLTKELHLSVGYASSLLGISRLGGLCVAVFTTFFIDRVNLRKAIFIMLFMTGILTALIGWVPVRALWIILFVQAACVAGFYPALFLSVARMFPAEVRSAATGFVLVLSIGIGAGGIPYLLGFSGDHLSFGFGFLLLGIAVALSSLLTFTLKELK
jgi:MFS family permease